MKFENGEYIIDYRKIIEFAPQIIKQHGGILYFFLKKKGVFTLVPFHNIK